LLVANPQLTFLIKGTLFMGTYLELPFYSGEIIAGRVTRLTDRCAIIDIRGWELPLETKFITWDAMTNPAEYLSLGERLEVMVQYDFSSHTLRKQGYPSPSFEKDGFWLNRLPLLDNPCPRLCERYQDGAVVEVEMIDYVNWYIARVRMPEGLIVELRTNDIHLRASNHSREYGRKLYQGERIRVVFRKISRPGSWVERFVGGSIAHDMTEAGFVTPGIASKKLNQHERTFIANRAIAALHLGEDSVLA
jgi:hypothetical protein